MTFLWFDALWLLALVPAAVLAYLLLMRRRKIALAYSSLTLLRGTLGTWQRVRRHVPPLMLLIAVAALALAAARPAAVVTLPADQRTVVLAIDTSLSMAADDVHPTRLDAAKAAAKSFIKSQPRDVRVGIVAFAAHADLVQRPTTDRAAAIEAIDGLTLQYNTAIGSGLVAALLAVVPRPEIAAEYDVFGLNQTPFGARGNMRGGASTEKTAHPANAVVGSNRSAAIVLLTDGRETMGVPPLKAAEMAADYGVRVYTVGFGKIDGALVNIAGHTFDAGFDEETLKTIAYMTRGQYFHASSAGELRDIYETLSSRIVLEKKQTELAALLTAVAALLALIAGGLSLTWSGRFA